MIPVILGGVAIASAIYGAKKGCDAKSNIDKSKKIDDDAKKIFNEARCLVEKKRDEASAALKHLGEAKIKIWNETLSPWADYIKCIKNVPGRSELEEEGGIGIFELVYEVQKVSIELQDALGALGAAGAAGAATSFGALGGVAAFASASTGTAISSLSGAAATNATLAWLGGGSLAAGGGGMALGTLVLGGIAVGPALAVAGWMAASKSEEAIAKARTNLNEAKLAKKEAEFAAKKLDSIVRFSNMHYESIILINHMLKPYLDWLREMMRKGADYKEFSEDEKERLYITNIGVCVLYNLCETPVIGDDGAVSRKVQNKIRFAKGVLGFGPNLNAIIEIGKETGCYQEL